MDVLSEDEMFPMFIKRSWSKLAVELDVNLSTHEKQIIQEVIDRDPRSILPIVEDILCTWINNKGENATLKALCTVFRKLGSEAIAG